MTRQRLLSILLGCLLAALTGHATRATAQDVAAAANAFAQGQRAELAGQFSRAAEFYELADSIAPTPEALRAAVKARRSAGDLSQAASAAERLLVRYPQDSRSRALADDVLSAARAELMRVTVECEQPCGIVVDGYAASTDGRERHVVYLKPGEHGAYATFPEGQTATTPVEAEAGSETTLRWSPGDALAPEPAPTPAAPPPAVPEATADDSAQGPETGDAHEANEAQRRNLSPIPFYVSAGVTAALGAVTVWSAVDVKNAADDFRKDDTPTQQEFDAGDAKDRRTNILFAASMVGVAATAVLGYFTFARRGEAPDRTPRSATEVHVAADHTGAGLVLRGAF